MGDGEQAVTGVWCGVVWHECVRVVHLPGARCKELLPQLVRLEVLAAGRGGGVSDPRKDGLATLFDLKAVKRQWKVKERQ